MAFRPKSADFRGQIDANYYFWGVPVGLIFALLGIFSDVIFDVKTVGQKVFQKCRIYDILEPKME